MSAASESLGSWTRGLRVPRALALEAIRFVSAVIVALSLVFLAFQVWSSFLLIPIHNPKYAAYAAQNIQIFALDQPVWTRYGVWLSDAFLGRLGYSYYFNLPVLDVVTTWLPATLELVFATTLWAIGIGVLLGWAAASRRLPFLGHVSRGAGLLLYALPLFWSLLLLSLGISETFHMPLGSPLPPNPVRPRPTGFPFLDALLSGNLDEAWLLFWTTSLLTLPAGAALSLPVLLRVRNALVRLRTAAAPMVPFSRRTGAFVAGFRALLPPLSGAVAIILPFAVSAAVFEEWFGGRRGVGWLLVFALSLLDGPLVQGAITVLTLAALFAAMPFALLEVGFLRRPAPGPSPRVVPDSAAVEGGMRAAFVRLRSRSAVMFWIGLVLLAIPLALTLLAPVLTPYGPLQGVTDTACSGPGGSPYLQPPCPTHPLGTSYFGYDVLSQVLYGGGLVMAATATALAISVGVSFGLALLSTLIGRLLDVPLRVALGTITLLPCLILLFLFYVAGISRSPMTPFAVALEVIFVPILYRDARNLAAPAMRPAPLVTATGAPTHGAPDRLMAAVAAIGPGLLARIPRRLAEMVLLFELFASLLTLSPTAVDWAQITSQGIDSNAVAMGNWGWLVLPGILLFLFASGLMLLSDGLRAILVPEPPRLGLAGISQASAPGPPPQEPLRPTEAEGQTVESVLDA